MRSSPGPPRVEAPPTPPARTSNPPSPRATGRRVRASVFASWRSWLGLLISAAFLAFAFRGQDLGAVRDALRRIDYGWVLPALALYFAGVWIRAVRWSVLLRPVVGVRARDVFPVVVVGYTANNVLPLRTGELVRAYLLRQRHGVRKTAALATIAVERLFDGLTMLGFMLAATVSITFTAELRRVALVACALFAALLAGFLVVALAGEGRDRLLRFALGPLPSGIAARVERVAGSFLSGLGVLTRRADLALVALTSLLAWGFEASMYWTIARGFEGELASAMTPAAALLTTGVANLATLIPASPGYVGTFETGVRLAVSGALGVPEATALSYAIVVHTALYLPITLWGAVEWWRQHLSLSRLRSPDDDGPEPESLVPARSAAPLPSPVRGGGAPRQ